MLSLLENTGRFAGFAAELLWRMPSALARPTDLADQCYRVGVGALPLVSAAAVSIGVVSWLQTRAMLADFGSETLLPGFVAVFVVVGLAPVLTGLVVSGQVGARLGAELGSMKITEQIDALESMGMGRTRYLAASRVLACVLMTPLLTVCLDCLALVASFSAEAIGGNMAWQLYAAESLRFLTLKNVLPATLSSLLFGFLIGSLSCWFGFEAGHGTEEVGRASTRGVVASMLAVLLANILWVRTSEILMNRLLP